MADLNRDLDTAPPSPPFELDDDPPCLSLSMIAAPPKTLAWPLGPRDWLTIRSVAGDAVTLIVDGWSGVVAELGRSEPGEYLITRGSRNDVAGSVTLHLGGRWTIRGNAGPERG